MIFRTAAAALFFAFSCSSSFAAGQLALANAVAEAEAQNPALQKAASALEETKWRRTESLSGFLPSVTASGSYLLDKKYAFLDVNLGGGLISIPQVVPTAVYGLGARLPIFDGLANVNRYKAAEQFVAAGTQELDWTRFALDRNVVLLYYKALGAQELRDVQAQNLATLEDHLRDAQLFKKAGVSTNYDVLRVEVQVSEARSALLDATDNIAVAKQNLAEVLGKPAEERLLAGELPVLKPDAITELGQPVADERSDVRALESRVSAMDKMESAASVHLVPKIFLFGDYQRYNNRDNSLSPSNAAFRDAYDFGVGFSWNLFDGAASIAKSKEAVEERYQAEKTLAQAELRSRSEYELWHRKFLYFCSVYTSRVADVDKAHESVRLAKAGLKAGARTNTDLLDAESDLFRAQAGVVTAQLGAIEALVNLELATGRRFYRFY
jgi:outer membrane protein TolC